MTRDFLKELGLNADAIDKVMAEYGKGVNAAKGDNEKIIAELEQTKADLQKANETLEKFKDYDNVKADVEKYKADLEKSKSDYEKKIATMELEKKVSEYTSGKKFVNDLTKDAINNQLAAALNDEANKGKSLDDLFNSITEGKENILVTENAPTPPITPNMKGESSGESGVLAAFKAMNPNIKF